MDEIAKELHKRVVRNFPRRKVFVSEKDEIFAADLVDMQEWANINDGYKYILTVIDCFTKYAWAIPLKDKTAKAVLKAFQDIFEQRIPQKVWVDEGKEFYNKDLEKYFKAKEITMYSTYGEHKSAIIERFNRTLKTKMYTKFTANNNRVWIKILPELIDEYNNSVHRTIKMTPVEASKDKNEYQVLDNFTNSRKVKATKAKLKVGDWVRISRIKGTFEKGYARNWSWEIFKVSEILDTEPITYKIKEYDGTPIKGSFYDQELQKTKDAEAFLIDKVLETRTKNRKKEHLVSWLGWPEKYNSWVADKDLKDLKDIKDLKK